MSDTPSRLLGLLSLLQARRDWPGAELAQRLDVSRRTIRRDVERLRALGYPVQSLTGPAVEQSIAGAFSRFEARVTVHASADEVASRLPYLGER